MLSKTVLNQAKVSCFAAQRSMASFNKEPKRISITGGCGNITYAIAFRIASGEFLGKDQPVIINLIDIPGTDKGLEGVRAELHDCSFPTLTEVVCTTDASKGFKDVDYNFLIGSKPRGPGMERGDLLKDNGKIFVGTGKAINDNAKADCKTIVVGNPANTNAMICAHHAPRIPKENFTAMTRLDANRALTQIALKAGCAVTDIKKMAIWGNHSPTMVPDVSNTTIAGKKFTDMVDAKWINDEFIPRVQKRGAEIIDLRGFSSAASAANAAVFHMRDWVLGSDDWQSMGVLSDGKSYGIPEGLMFSVPCHNKGGKWEMVKGLNLDDETIQARLKKTTDELLSERSAVEHLLK
jgi:malate dehydrogenase